MRRLLPDFADDVDLVAAYAYPGGPYVRANMVASADGASAVKGVTQGLSSAADRRLLALLRGLSDVILVGASTVRAEGYRPVRPREVWEHLRAGRTRTPPLAVLTRRLDLDLTGPLFTEAPDDARTIVITTASAPADRLATAADNADLVVAGTDRVDMKDAVAELVRRGHERILCEGGPRVLAQVAAAGLLDELCLTVSPLLVAGGASRVLSGPSIPDTLPMRIGHLIEDDDALFLRYTRRTP
ncbi:MAG: pyrimidine reductase family protein [Streptosporangiales bacterium]|nr:pyrimidine reductase family protein [Streptosporangiales bacterium]